MVITFSALALAGLAVMVGIWGPALDPIADDGLYHCTASSLVEGHGFKLHALGATWRAPLPPLFVLLLSGLLAAGVPPTYGSILSLLSVVGLPAVVYLVLRGRLQLIVIFAAALYWNRYFQVYSHLQWPDPLFALLLTAHLASLSFESRPRVTLLAVTGLLLPYMKTVGIIVVGAEFATVLALAAIRRDRGMLPVLCVLLTSLLVAIPWHLYRGQVVEGLQIISAKTTDPIPQLASPVLQYILGLGRIVFPFSTRLGPAQAFAEFLGALLLLGGTVAGLLCRRRPFRAPLAVSLFILLSVYVAFPGGGGHEVRYLLGIYPVLLLITLDPVSHMFATTARRRLASLICLLLLAGGAAGVRDLVAPPVPVFDASTAEERAYVRGISRYEGPRLEYATDQIEFARAIASLRPDLPIHTSLWLHARAGLAVVTRRRVRALEPGPVGPALLWIDRRESQPAAASKVFEGRRMVGYLLDAR